MPKAGTLEVSRFANEFSTLFDVGFSEIENRQSAGKDLGFKRFIGFRWITKVKGLRCLGLKGD